MSISFKRGPEYGFDIIHHTVVLVDKGSPFFVAQGHWNPRPSRQGKGSAQVIRDCAYLQQGRRRRRHVHPVKADARAPAAISWMAMVRAGLRASSRSVRAL